MSNKHISEVVGVKLITCIVERGNADAIIKHVLELGGVGATTYFARGRGVREQMGVWGVAINVEKEVIEFITSAESADSLMKQIAAYAELDKPGRGVVFSTTIDAVYTYVPDTVFADDASN